MELCRSTKTATGKPCQVKTGGGLCWRHQLVKAKSKSPIKKSSRKIEVPILEKRKSKPKVMEVVPDKTWLVKDLKEFAKQHNIKVSGKKEEILNKILVSLPERGSSQKIETKVQKPPKKSPSPKKVKPEVQATNLDEWIIEALSEEGASVLLDDPLLTFELNPDFYVDRKLMKDLKMKKRIKDYTLTMETDLRYGSIHLDFKGPVTLKYEFQFDGGELHDCRWTRLIGIDSEMNRYLRAHKRSAFGKEQFIPQEGIKPVGNLVEAVERIMFRGPESQVAKTINIDSTLGKVFKPETLKTLLKDPYFGFEIDEKYYRDGAIAKQVKRTRTIEGHPLKLRIVRMGPNVTVYLEVAGENTVYTFGFTEEKELFEAGWISKGTKREFRRASEGMFFGQRQTTEQMGQEPKGKIVDFARRIAFSK